jgi:hypothetical protein
LTVTNLSPTGYATDLLQVGKAVYGDRAYTFATPIPSDLVGQIYIKTNNSDKDSTTLSLSFNVNQPVTVVVALAGTITTPPKWLQGWTKRTDQLTTTDVNKGRILYEESFNTGKITLGANRDSSMPTGNSMYSVIVLPGKN